MWEIFPVFPDLPHLPDLAAGKRAAAGGSRSDKLISGKEANEETGKKGEFMGSQRVAGSVSISNF